MWRHTLPVGATPHGLPRRLAVRGTYVRICGAFRESATQSAPPEKFLAAMAPGAARSSPPARTWPYSPPARPPATVPHNWYAPMVTAGGRRLTCRRCDSGRRPSGGWTWSGQWRVEGSTISSRAVMEIMDDDEFGRTRRRRRRLESPWLDSLGHNGEDDDGEDELWC